MPTVTAIYPIEDGLTGSLNVEDASGGKYTHPYHVEFDGTNVNHWAALAAVNEAATIPDDEVFSIPEYGAAHPEDNTSLVVEKTADPVPDSWGKTWKVMVRYAYPKVDTTAGGSPPEPSDTTGGQGNDPPFPLPNVHRSWGTWTRQRGFNRDYANALITNSAGDPFIPALTTDEQLSQVTFVRSQTSFNPKWKNEFEGGINDRAFRLCSSPVWEPEKWSLKVISITGDETPATGKTPAWWTVTIVIQHNPYLWILKPLDQGGRTLVAGVKSKILQNGVPIVALLDGSGGRLADAGTPVFLDGVAPATKGPFRVNQSVDFRWLGLTV